jgi:hypothetical protein
MDMVTRSALDAGLLDTVQIGGKRPVPKGVGRERRLEPKIDRKTMALNRAQAPTIGGEGIALLALLWQFRREEVH